MGVGIREGGQRQIAKQTAASDSTGAGGIWGALRGTEGAAAYDAMMEGRLSQHRKKIEKNWLDTSTLEPEEINGQPASASYVGYRPTVIN
jgi:hypothetical protein